MGLSREGFRRGAPWAAGILLLYALQVWAIWGSEFTLEVTALQALFVVAFVVLVFVLAEAGVREG